MKKANEKDISFVLNKVVEFPTFFKIENFENASLLLCLDDATKHVVQDIPWKEITKPAPLVDDSAPIEIRIQQELDVDDFNKGFKLAIVKLRDAYGRIVTEIIDLQQVINDNSTIAPCLSEAPQEQVDDMQATLLVALVNMISHFVRLAALRGLLSPYGDKFLITLSHFDTQDARLNDTRHTYDPARIQAQYAALFQKETELNHALDHLTPEALDTLLQRVTTLTDKVLRPELEQYKQLYADAFAPPGPEPGELPSDGAGSGALSYSDCLLLIKEQQLLIEKMQGVVADLSARLAGLTSRVDGIDVRMDCEKRASKVGAMQAEVLTNVGNALQNNPLTVRRVDLDAMSGLVNELETMDKTGGTWKRAKAIALSARTS